MKKLTKPNSSLLAAIGTSVLKLHSLRVIWPLILSKKFHSFTGIDSIAYNKVGGILVLKTESKCEKGLRPIAL